MKKTIFFLVIFWVMISALSFAEDILYGPYGVDEGLQKYQDVTKRKIYHLGDDNALKDYVGQCTWFCYASTKERMPTGNAYEWYDSFAGQYPDRVGSEPKVGAICVWESCSDYSVNGHVGKVTKVFSDGSFTIWESNYKSQMITCRTITSRDHVKGFIYPQGVDMTAAPEQVSTDHADSAEAMKPFAVVVDDCYPASFAEVLPSDRVWVTFNSIVDKKVTPDNFNKYVQFKTEYRSTTYLKREDKNGRTTFYFYSKFWVPGDRIKIKILKDLKDINGQKLGKDYTMSFCLHKQKLVSTGPAPNIHSPGYELIKSHKLIFVKYISSVHDCMIDDAGNLWIASISTFVKFMPNYDNYVAFFGTSDIDLLNIGSLCNDGNKVYLLAHVRIKGTVTDAILEYNVNNGTLVYKVCSIDYGTFRRPRMIVRNNIAVIYDRLDPYSARIRIINLNNNTYICQKDTSNCPYLKNVNMDHPIAMDQHGNIYIINEGEDKSYIVALDQSLNFIGNVMLPNLKKGEMIYNMDIDQKGDFYLLIRRSNDWYFEKYQAYNLKLRLIFTCKTATNAEFIRTKNGEFVVIGNTYEVFIMKKK